MKRAHLPVPVPADLLLRSLSDGVSTNSASAVFFGVFLATVEFSREEEPCVDYSFRGESKLLSSVRSDDTPWSAFQHRAVW